MLLYSGLLGLMSASTWSPLWSIMIYFLWLKIQPMHWMSPTSTASSPPSVSILPQSLSLYGLLPNATIKMLMLSLQQQHRHQKWDLHLFAPCKWSSCSLPLRPRKCVMQDSHMSYYQSYTMASWRALESLCSTGFNVLKTPQVCSTRTHQKIVENHVLKYQGPQKWFPICYKPI